IDSSAENGGGKRHHEPALCAATPKPTRGSPARQPTQVARPADPSPPAIRLHRLTPLERDLPSVLRWTGTEPKARSKSFKTHIKALHATLTSAKYYPPRCPVQAGKREARWELEFKFELAAKLIRPGA